MFGEKQRVFNQVKVIDVEQSGQILSNGVVLFLVIISVIIGIAIVMAIVWDKTRGWNKNKRYTLMILMVSLAIIIGIYLLYI